MMRYRKFLQVDIIYAFVTAESSSKKTAAFEKPKYVLDKEERLMLSLFASQSEAFNFGKERKGIYNAPLPNN